jgi:transcriptional regulator with XRE-family HTH domain
MEQPQLGLLIADLRKKQGLTQEELVDLCSINVRTIQRIEAGEVNPRSYTIKNILEALGTTLDDVFKEENQAPTQQVESDLPVLNNTYLILGGVSGIVYMILFTIVVFSSLSYSIYDDKLLLDFTYTAASVGSFVFLALFYGVLMYVAKHKAGAFVMYSMLAFILICLVTTVVDISFYTNNLYHDDYNDVIMISTSSFIYGLGYLFMGIALFIQRKRLGNIAKWAGIAGMVGGLGYATIILFPAGILGTLIFEVLLIAFLFMSIGHKKTSGENSRG